MYVNKKLREFRLFYKSTCIGLQATIPFPTVDTAVRTRLLLYLAFWPLGT
jgi:hypothetical protein